MTTTAIASALDTACVAGFNAGNPTYAKPSVRRDWKTAFESGVSLEDAQAAFKQVVAEGIAKVKPEDLDKIEKKFLSAGYQRGFYLGYAMFRGLSDGTAALAASLPIAWTDIAEASQADDIVSAFNAIIEIGQDDKDAAKVKRDHDKVDLLIQVQPFINAMAFNAGKVLDTNERKALLNAQALINGLLK